MESSSNGVSGLGECACPHCGQAAPPGTLAGLCPACLLRQGAAGDTVFPEKFTPPEPVELAGLFPQLEILGLIGSGGMGAVYQARQRGLDRIVALKILPPGIGDRPGFAERFTREAKALAKLSHPGIVTIHDTGRAEGLYFLLMEYVDGSNLRRLIERGKGSSREALATVPMICNALQYAHDAGIVHRDIKPENILLDRQGRAKLADFGLAKLVGAEEPVFPDAHGASPYLTAAGELMGTPLYMAPEQTERPGEVDHRADIYSLGVVLYQMLTGELPEVDPMAPSRKAAMDVRLDEVVLRALERDPGRRQQRVSELGHAVETILSTPAPNDPPATKTTEVKFNCPGCGQRLSAEGTAAGSEVACPTCSQAMVIPGAPPAPGPPPQPAIRQPPVPPPVPKSGKGLAVASLVMALIGLVPVVGLATGVIGLLIGAVVLAKGAAGKGFAIAGIVAGCAASLMIPLHLAMLNTTLTAAKFGAGTAHCSQNLKRIGVGIAAYRKKHGGEYPPSLDALVRERFVPAETLRCPLHEGKTGYAYARPVMADPRGLLVWDRLPHRAAAGKLAGRNALDVDLSVRFVPEAQFRTTPKVIGGAAPPPKPRHGVPSPTQKPTVAAALDSLAKLGPREKRQPLKFLADASPEEGPRAAVIAALKPLLNDVDCGEMAFNAFAKWAGAEEVPDMMEIVRIAPSSSRGKEAMRWLSRSGDARAAGPLAECLADHRSLPNAKAALAALGAVAKPAVLPFYHHENGNVREVARELLRGYQATEEEILEESIRALGETGAGSRISALDALATAKLTPEKRVHAASAVRPLVTDPHWGVAESARKALKSLATPADADFLLALVDSPDRNTREFATETLLRFEDARVAEPLAVLLADEHLSYWAGDRLIELGRAAEPAIIPYLSQKHEMTRRRAADTLAKIGTSASIPALETLKNADEFFVRVAGEGAIQAIQAREQREKDR